MSPFLPHRSKRDQRWRNGMPMTTGERPRIVCLCGSTKFLSAFEIANRDETLAGHIVLSIGADLKFRDRDFLEATKTKEELAAIKDSLDRLHRQKIDLADEILVLNVDGHIGVSTEREIEYARQTGKRVRFLEAQPET
jgi:hypothetical protein